MASVRQKGSRWYIRYREYVDGRQVEREVPAIGARNKTAAKEMAKKLDVGLKEGGFSPATQDKVTAVWRKFEASYLKTKREATRKSYGVAFNSHWLKAIGDQPLARLKPEVIEEKLWEFPGLKASTRRLLLIQLSGLYRWAIDHGYAASNPCKKVAKPEGSDSTLRTLSPVDAELILRQVDRRYFPHLLTLYLSGLRLGELRALTWDDYDEDAWSLSVSKTVYRNGAEAISRTGRPFSKPKSKKSSRTVYVEKALVATLAEWRVFGWHNGCPKLYGLPQPLMFPMPSGEPFNENTLREALRAAAREAVRKHAEANPSGELRVLPREKRLGFDPETLTLHHLRHGYARRMLENGMLLAELREQMGHSNFDTTLQYAAYAVTQRPRVLDLLDGRVEKQSVGKPVGSFRKPQKETAGGKGFAQ